MAFELIKVSELPELTTPADANVLPIQDGDYLKRISFENLKEAVTDDVADDLAAEVTARESAVSDEATARGNADTVILADLASPYSASATYAVGDYCTKDGQLYRCTTAISTAEAWTAAHWSAVALGNDTSDLRSALNAVESAVEGKQDTLTFDNTPTANSTNPVKSGGVYTAIATEKTRAEAEEARLEALFTAPTQEAVDNWLDEHPEATTTVQDGSITEAKLNSALKDDMILFVSNASELASAISNGNKIIAFTDSTAVEISSTLTIPDGTTIIGNGAQFTRASGFDGKMISAGANCNISNIKIDGNRSSVVSPAWDKTIEISLNGFCTLENCIFEHGNECVIAYGNSNRVTHCKFTDCGGNAVHFSGGRYTVVDGCYVSGANKKSGMGHENGCIIWSSECAYATCVNNYCEDAKSGFGQIGSIHAGYVKIIGNTVKDCQYACVVGNSATDTPSAREVVIANNIFINCVKIDLYKTVSMTCDTGRVTIVGNNLVETAITADRMTNILISGNNLRGKVARAYLQRCSNCVIADNIVNNTANREKALSLYICYGCHVVGNYIRGGKETIWANSCADCDFDSNKISAYCTTDSDVGVNIPTNGVFRNNIVRTYGRGLNAGTGCQIVANQFWLANNSTAVRTWGGTSNAVVALNITNKTNSLSGTLGGYVGNITGATADVFTTATLTLTNVTSNGVTTAVLGDDYICQLTADEGYSLPDTITVSVNNVTLYPSEYVYDKTTGEVEVYGIVGAVVITATGVSEG